MNKYKTKNEKIKNLESRYLMIDTYDIVRLQGKSTNKK